MANRHLFRTIVLQVLFEWDMRGYQHQSLESYIDYNLDDFNMSVGIEDPSEVKDLVLQVAKKQIVLDDIIEKAAPSWPIDKISVTDRNILRLGLHELLFGDRDKVPPKVAINEAIELAKTFGGGKSGKFVNGVIGAVYREIGEPGKDDKPKKSIPDVPYEDMPIDQKAGAVIYSADANNTIRIGMVHDVFGYWTLSKGGIKEGETPDTGVVRAVKEETNWDITVDEQLGENEYIAYHPERGPVRKNVQYFLAQSAHVEPTLEQGSGGLDDVKWFGLDEISELNIYDDVSQMITKAIGILAEKYAVEPEPEPEEAPLVSDSIEDSSDK